MSRRTRWAAVFCAMMVLTVSVARGAQRQAPPGERPTVKYAVLNVSGPLPESLPPVYLFEREGDTLHGLLERIERARRDDAVTGIIVRMRGFAGGWAKAQEVRRALERARAAGKDVVCLLESAGNLTYYIAAGADRVVMVPGGRLFLSGLRAEAIFAGELLEKVGVKPELIQVGRHKGAADALTRTDLSEEYRSTLQAVLDSYYAQLQQGLVEGRGLPVSRVEVLLRRGPFTAQAAREADLVDDVMFYDQLLEALEGRHEGRLVAQTDYGRRAPESPLQAGQFNLLQMLMGGRRPRREAPPGPAVAVIHASGPLVMDSEDGLSLGEQVVSARRLLRVIAEAAADDSVEAIVVRVDSPGGSALAADVIWHALRRADGQKPVIASLGDTAASGGYYIGAGARTIVSEPGTLTGAIGVLGGKLVFTDLLAKLGLSVDVVESGVGGGLMSPFKEYSTAEKARVRELLEDTYRTFIERVAETREGMSFRDVERVADGRIWTGLQAHQNGLVDRLGGLEDAIALAREAAGIPEDQDVRVLHLPRPRNLAEMLLFGPDEQALLPARGAHEVLRHLPGVESYLTALLSLREEKALCLMPAVITIR